MEFPYTKSVSSIPRLFGEIRKVGMPSKVTVNYLAGIGFTSSNDRYLVGLLKGIDFVNSGGNPTDRWKDYRGHHHKQVMAEALRIGYGTLFQIYPDADKRSDEALANYVRQNSDYGADTVSRVVGSFKALCALADFGATQATAQPVPVSENPPVVSPATPLGAGQPPINPNQPVINLNIQLELPAQADEKFYDAFFKAMKKHLMPDPPAGQ